MGAAAVSWDHYRALLAVAECGSLSAAARRLGLAQPTLGRQIDALEGSLGLKLFVRSPTGLVLTDEGRDLLPDARAMAAAAEALARSASAGKDEARGGVRITASEIIGGLVLPPILGRLQDKRRGLIFELVLTNRAEDLLRRDADIAVRMMEPKQASIVARRIGAIRLGLFAHRDYLDRRGRPQTLEDLQAHTVIGFDRDDSAARAVGAPESLTRSAFGFRTDSDLAQFTALRTGVGVGVCQAPLARTLPELEPVLDAQLSFQLEMWLAMHEDLRSSRRIRATFDHLVAELRHYVEQRAGLRAPTRDG